MVHLNSFSCFQCRTSHVHRKVNGLVTYIFNYTEAANCKYPEVGLRTLSYQLSTYCVPVYGGAVAKEAHITSALHGDRHGNRSFSPCVEGCTGCLQLVEGESSSARCWQGGLKESSFQPKSYFLVILKNDTYCTSVDLLTINKFTLNCP